jgi:hypothetical protein
MRLMHLTNGGPMDEFVLLFLITLGTASVLSAAWLHFGTLKRNGRPSLEARGGRKSALKGRGLRRPRPRDTVRPARAGSNRGAASVLSARPLQKPAPKPYAADP